MRLICYNQSIYDDNCLELDEFAGLTLGVIDNNNVLTTVLTEVQPMYDQASILIVDNDSEFIQTPPPLCPSISTAQSTGQLFYNSVTWLCILLHIFFLRNLLGYVM